MPRKARRLLAIAHAMGGMTFTAAAEAVGMERQALYDAIKRYNVESTDGLNYRPKSGRIRKLTKDQENECKEIIEKGPDPETDGISAYTLRDLADTHKNALRCGSRMKPASARKAGSHIAGGGAANARRANAITALHSPISLQRCARAAMTLMLGSCRMRINRQCSIFPIVFLQNAMQMSTPLWCLIRPPGMIRGHWITCCVS